MKLSRILTAGIALTGALVMIGISIIDDEVPMAKSSKMVLFSEVSGVVTNNGEPVEGAEVVQKVLYKDVDEVPATTAHSDENGAFAFNEISRRKPIRLLPGEITIGQTVVIHYDGKTYEGWHHSKQGFDENTELDGRPLKLVCELTTAPDFEGTHYGICREAKD